MKPEIPTHAQTPGETVFSALVCKTVRTDGPENESYVLLDIPTAVQELETLFEESSILDYLRYGYIVYTPTHAYAQVVEHYEYWEEPAEEEPLLEDSAEHIYASLCFDNATGGL